MRNLEEIKKTMGMKIKAEKNNGFGGSIFPIEYKKGKAKIVQDYDKVLNFMFSWACGFEHLSVSTTVKTPDWEQMCKMKDIFWKEDEVKIQHLFYFSSIHCTSSNATWPFPIIIALTSLVRKPVYGFCQLVA